MIPIIDGYRAMLFRNQSAITLALVVARVVPAAHLAIAWVTFHNSKYAFAENV
jgi:ABC-type polysaccharide/polyol phosphate export permease